MSEPNSRESGRGALSELKDAVTHLFQQVTGLAPDLGLKPDFPRSELKIDDDAFRALVELPGMRREDIDVSVTGRALRISGNRPRFEPPSGGRVIRSERPTGRFDLNVHLPAEIDTLGVTARMREGVLEVRLPKLQETRGRSIDVEADEAARPRPESRPDPGPAPGPEPGPWTGPDSEPPGGDYS